MKINIVDALPGTGKTSAAINYINSAPTETRFLYITPFLTEVTRIIKSCPDKNFAQPENYGSKLNGIKALFNKGRNIVSTHALFSSFDQEIIDLAQSYGYVLIMDEVAEVVHQLTISDEDLNTILEKYAEIQDGHILHWTNDSYTGKFEEYKRLCELDAVGIYGGMALLWMFPVKTFQAFDEIYILTYMFDAQMQRYYYDYYGLEYNYLYVRGNSLDTYQFTEEKIIYELPDYSKLIHICDNERLNKIGVAEGALSKSWYMRNANNDCMRQIKNNLNNFFRRIRNTPSSQNLWTTFGDFQKSLGGKGYAKGFLSCNARATNNYRQCTSLAYLVNRYFNPVIRNFFVANGIRVEEDAYATSEMLQWIFRSAVRDGKEIWLYVPSRRARNLLIDWLGGSSDKQVQIGQDVYSNYAI